VAFSAAFLPIRRWGDHRASTVLGRRSAVLWRQRRKQPTRFVAFCAIPPAPVQMTCSVMGFHVPVCAPEVNGSCSPSQPSRLTLRAYILHDRTGADHVGAPSPLGLYIAPTLNSFLECPRLEGKWER